MRAPPGEPEREPGAIPEPAGGVLARRARATWPPGVPAGGTGSFGRFGLREALPSFLALAACLAEPERAPEAAGLPRGTELVLPGDWRVSSPEAFATWVQSALPEASLTPIEKNSLRELQKALDEVVTPMGDGAFDPLAVRAAVILGRSRSSPGASLLIRRLEKRALGPERYSDCGDTLAAAALARFPDPARHAQRLVPLAVGSRPHPDLEVRVECAATALHAGFQEVIPFLLQVLRIDTHAGQSDRRDFAVSPTTAWARGRAAEALSTYAGVALTYRPDGSIAHREDEAARLEALLLPGPRAEEPQRPAGTRDRVP